MLARGLVLVGGRGHGFMGGSWMGGEGRWLVCSFLGIVGLGRGGMGVGMGRGAYRRRR